MIQPQHPGLVLYKEEQGLRCGCLFYQEEDLRFWKETSVSEEASNGIACFYRQRSRRDSHAIQNDNFSTPLNNIHIYCITKELDLLGFNPTCPKNPKTFGERRRKSRMDKGLQIKELAKIIGVTPDTIINWELRNVKPRENFWRDLKYGFRFNENNKTNLSYIKLNLLWGRRNINNLILL